MLIPQNDANIGKAIEQATPNRAHDKIELIISLTKALLRRIANNIVERELIGRIAELAIHIDDAVPDHIF